VTAQKRNPFVVTASAGPYGTGGPKPIDRILDALKQCGKKVKASAGGQYSAQCSAHEDHRPSLRLKAADDGKVLITCQAGCKPEAVIEALGLRWSDLRPGDGPPEKNGEAKGKVIAEGPWIIAGEYLYRDEAGVVLYKVVRRERMITIQNADGSTRQKREKEFPQFRPDGAGGWTPGIEGIRRVPYRLPELLAAPTDAVIYVVEGEKCVDALTALDQVALTTSGGANNWNKTDKDAVRKVVTGRRLVILPDNDNPGRGYAADARGDLLPVAVEVKILGLPGLPEHGDIVDWLADDHTVAELESLADELAPETPGSAAKADNYDKPNGWPDPIHLADEPVVPAFPTEVLPPRLYEFSRRVAWALNAPPDFVGVTMLTLAAGAIGNARRLKLSATQFQPSLLYAALIGLPGTVKSPVMKFLTGPFDDIQSGWNGDYLSELAEWEKSKGAQDDDEGGERKPKPKPQLKSLIARNFTTESLALTLHHNPRGIVAPFDELAALFLGLNQYKGGSGNDRQVYLSIWTQDTVNIIRKSDMRAGIPPIFVLNPCVNIVGAIQPDLLCSIRGQSVRRGELPPDDGALDRFLFTWPATLPDIADDARDLSQAVLQVWPAAVRKLVHELDDGEVRLSTDARKAWVQFTCDHAAEVNSDEFPDHLRGPWAKLKAYAARLALVLHLVWWTEGQIVDVGTLDAEALLRAVQLAAYFKRHVRKVHAHIGADPRIEHARRVVRWIREHRRTQFTRREVFEGVKGTIKTVDLLSPILELLEAQYLIRSTGPPDRQGPGRKPSPTYEVNPKLLAERAPNSANSAKSAKGFQREEPQQEPSPESESGSHNAHYSQNGADERADGELFGAGEDVGPIRG